MDGDLSEVGAMLDLLEAAGVGLDDLYQLQEIQDIQDIQDLVNLNTLHDLVLENPTPKTNVDDSVTYDSVDGKSTKGRRNKSRQGGRNNIKGSSRRNRGRKKDRNRPKLRNEGMGGKSGDVEGSEGSNDADLASFYQYVDELHSGNRNISHRAIHRQRRGLGHGMGHYSDPVSRGRNTTSRMDLGVGMGVDFKEMGIQEVDEMMELEFMAQLLNQSHFSHYHSNRSYQSQVPGSPPYTASTPSHKMSSSSAVHVHTNEDQHFPEDDSCRSREDTSNSPSRRTHRREPKKRKEKKEEREREREHEKKKTKEKKTEEEGQRRRKRKKKKRLVADVSASALPSSPLSSSSFSSTSVASPASLPGSSSLTMSEQRGADRPSNLHSSGITYLAHSPTSQTGVVDDKTGKKSGFTKSTTNNAKNSRAGKHCKHQLTMTESQTSEREAAALSSVTPPLSSACSSALSFPCMFPKCNQMWRVNATSSLTITATQRKRLKLEVTQHLRVMLSYGDGSHLLTHIDPIFGEHVACAVCKLPFSSSKDLLAHLNTEGSSATRRVRIRSRSTSTLQSGSVGHARGSQGSRGPHTGGNNNHNSNENGGAGVDTDVNGVLADDDFIDEWDDSDEENDSARQHRKTLDGIIGHLTTLQASILASMHSGQKNGKKEREEYAKGVDCGDGEDDEEEKDRRKRKRENEHKARTNEESESLGHLPGAQSLSHSQLKSEIEVETNAAADRDDVDAIELDHSRVSRHSAIEKKQKLSESLHPDDVDLLLQKCGYPSSFFQNVLGGASDLSALFEELNEFEQFSSSFDYDGHYDDDGVGNGADDENEEEGESATTFVDVEDGELRSNSPKDLPANDVDHDCVDNNREEKGKKDREEGKKGRHLSDEKKSKCRAKAGNEGDTNDRDDDSDTGDDDDNEEYDSNFTSAIRKNTGRRSSKAPASFRHTTKTANTGVHFPVPSTSEMNEVIVMHELMVQVSQATGMSLEELAMMEEEEAMDLVMMMHASLGDGVKVGEGGEERKDRKI